MLAKKDDMLLELKKTLATKNAEHALAVKNVELAARRCNNLQSEPKAKRNAMRCYRCGNKKAGTYHMMSKTPPRLSIALHQMQSERLTGLRQQDMRLATSAKRKPKDL